MDTAFLQNPYNGQALKWINQPKRKGVVDVHGTFFPYQDGYLNFLAGRRISGLNQKFQRFYDRTSRLARFLGHWLLRQLLPGDLGSDVQGAVRINPGDQVLEIAVGTGRNLKSLPADARYFGVDISGGMLEQCVRNARKWGLQLELCQASAEELPYRDNVFDSVFHFGGIHFFNDPEQAIREMIRVAKPGAPIVLVDNTLRALNARYRRNPLLRTYLRPTEVARPGFYAPREMVPGAMLDVELQFINEGELYRLSFVKPPGYG